MRIFILSEGYSSKTQPLFAQVHEILQRLESELLSAYVHQLLGMLSLTLTLVVSIIVPFVACIVHSVH